jgi:hypothetical protein
VSDRDAFEDEMGFLGSASDATVERLLTGRGHDADRNGETEDVAAFVIALRAAVPARPRPELEDALVPRLVSAARSSGDAAAQARTTSISVPRTGVWRRRLALVGRAAVALVLAVAAMAGLALAGVRIPEPARDAFEFAGVELPNQDDESDDPSDGAAGAGAGEDAEPRSSEAKEGGPTADEGSAGTESANRGARHRGKDRSHKGKDKEQQGSSGGGNGAPAAPPADTGPTGVPPGQGGVPPGHGGTPPGQAAPPPGQGGTPPGQAAPPPGQGGTPPGQGGAIPGSGSGGQSLESHGGGPPGGVPPGQAKPK